MLHTVIFWRWATAQGFVHLLDRKAVNYHVIVKQLYYNWQQSLNKVRKLPPSGANFTNNNKSLTSASRTNHNEEPLPGGSSLDFRSNRIVRFVFPPFGKNVISWPKVAIGKLGLLVAMPPTLQENPTIPNARLDTFVVSNRRYCRDFGRFSIALLLSQSLSLRTWCGVVKKTSTPTNVVENEILIYVAIKKPRSTRFDVLLTFITTRFSQASCFFAIRQIPNIL